MFSPEPRTTMLQPGKLADAVPRGDGPAHCSGGRIFLGSLKIVQGCKEEGAGEEAENPAALLLACSKEFTDIIQSLMPAGRTHMQSEDALSTEIVLLALIELPCIDGLFDSLFHTIYKFIRKMPPDSFKSVNVKSVLRIGGISSLQDMPLRNICHRHPRCHPGPGANPGALHGDSTEYCLSGEAAASPIGGCLGDILPCRSSTVVLGCYGTGRCQVTTG